MPRFPIDAQYLVGLLEDLINTPSPTGDTAWAVSFVQNELDSVGALTAITANGALLAQYAGLRDDRPRALTCHIDTPGAMVAEIKPSGRLRISPLGEIDWAGLQGEAVTIQPRSGTGIRGSIVCGQNDEFAVRVDERTSSIDETRMLGIEIGDFISIDPRFEKTPSGFVRSRFLDAKSCVACLVTALRALSEAGVSPAQRTHVLISNFEEVGQPERGSLPVDLHEHVILDMAPVGAGQNGSEYHCSLCVKDMRTPYSKDLNDKMAAIATRAGIELRRDIFPNRSGGGWIGGTARVARFGPGLDSAQGYERTHVDALVDAANLIAEYLIEEE